MAGKMSQQVKAIDTNPDDPSLVSRTCLVERQTLSYHRDARTFMFTASVFAIARN